MQKKIKIILLFLFLLLGSFCYAQEIPKTIFVKETIANKTPLPNLGKNEVFTAGDFEITVLERTGTNGIFSGKGFMVVPYLADTKIAVEFNDIKINSDYQMYDGFVFTTYDKTWGNVVDVTTGTGEGAGSQVEVVIQYEIKTIAINPNTGEIIVVGPNGETTTLPGGKDTVITDSKGATYAVDKDGAVVGPMQAAPGGKPTPKNTDGVDKNGQSTEFTASGVAVKFYNVASYNNKGDNSKNSVYALDEAADDKVKEIAKLYKRVKGSQGEDYWLVTKAIENKKEDTFLAEVHITDSKIVSDSIYFRTQNGVEIPKTKFGNHLILTLKGNQSYAEEEVLATIKQDGKWQVAGAFKLVHISPKDISVTLVAMDGATIPPDVEENIRKQYQGLALNFNFTRAKPFSSGFAKDQIDVGDSGWLETYTADQLDINKAFKDSPSSNYKQETYYLFFTNTPPSKSGTQGFMPLKGQFGYIFGNGGAKTPAHELGHGIFGLEHPFQDKNIQSSEGASSWLMDYGRNPILGSIGLPAYHWKQMYDPKFRLYVFQGDSEGEYETDGHYSTVYLVSLMLGMTDSKAKELAIATEAPDTTIHSDTKFELNDTWGHLDGSQQNIHSLTGGFHGIEEFFTAIKFLYAPKTDIKLQGEMLHRFGDTYAHSQIGNFKPLDMKENINLKDADDATIKKYIDSWKQIGTETTLGSEIKPWIKFFNYYLEKDGLEFLNNETKQKEIFKGKTLKESLKDLYLTNKSSDFVMYGGNGFTFDHAKTDDSYPDMIYLRPDWYYIYVQNLSWIISTKYGLDNSKLDLSVFDRMINFLKNHANDKPSMKGIIDYEVAKKLGKKEFYIPVFYSEPDRILASGDAVVKTNYLNIAKDIVNKTKQYLNEQGISSDKITVEEIDNWFNPKINTNGVFVTEAFKITIK